MIANAAERLPSIERGVKNQSELGLKLPEINIKHYRGMGGSGNHSREASISNTDDKKERLR